MCRIMSLRGFAAALPPLILQMLATVNMSARYYDILLHSKAISLRKNRLSQAICLVLIRSRVTKLYRIIVVILLEMMQMILNVFSLSCWICIMSDHIDLLDFYIERDRIP